MNHTEKTMADIDLSMSMRLERSAAYIAGA